MRITKLAKTRGPIYKVGCSKCNWKGRITDTYTIQDPDEIHHDVIICPRCRETNTMDRICYLPSCWKRIANDDTSYRLCFEHRKT